MKKCLICRETKKENEFQMSKRHTKDGLTSACNSCACTRNKSKRVKFSNHPTNLIDHRGEVFERLTVIDFSHVVGKAFYWECKCICGEVCKVKYNHLRIRKTRSCGCLSKGINSQQYKGVGEMYGQMWTNILSSAKKRDIPVQISIDYAYNLYLAQNKKCNLTGLPIKFGSRYKKDNITASLDRIDSGLGYVEGNVQWVHKDINKMKQNLKEKDFIKLCTLVAEYKVESCIEELRVGGYKA